ncbi:DNA polymerase I [Segniliparus rugosus]|uniref:DNA polymerase I n=1 Tax=Segniliparus rugosus (strain ATCC BAA-974 / DSM 45345 / CCUG 50838 / CIP 108380 / JCM 13579 / CDC 945) TaxID=679197 RepID=E5XUI2_SEGRC|nr:DNA polymerase I [Segniliparus rugosus]EFV11961.1 DNA polymerase I [Segniliparus rugosus ATCC BAA-974]
MDSPKHKLLLLDGHSLAFRAFYALPEENFRTAEGLTTNAVYGFVSMLINLLRDEDPTHVAVAFDISRKTFRSQMYPEYKATRSKSPESFPGQVDLIKEVLGALGIVWEAHEGYEADDIIATYATQGQQQGYQVLIMTGDRDALQLVTPDITVLYPNRGVSDLIRYTPEQVEEKYGLSPAQYPDFAALRGDPSDNLPKIPGVGEKTASSWVKSYHSLAELLERADEVTGKTGQALRDHLDQVRRNRQLTELVRDMEVDHAVADLTRQQWDRDQVHALFDRLEFRVLRDRLFATLGAVEPEAEESVEVAGELLAPGAVGAWLAEHARDGERCGVAVHGAQVPSGGGGTPLKDGGGAWLVAIAGADGHGAAIRTETMTPEDVRALDGWLADPAVPKAFHEAKWATHALRGGGFAEIAGVTTDTGLAAYIARPGQRSFNLPDLALRYLRRQLGPEDGGEKQLSLLDDSTGEDKEADDSITEAAAIRELGGALDDVLDKAGSADLLRTMELPLTFVLARMEEAGIAVDQDGLAGLHADFAARVKQAAESAYSVIGKEINLGSPKQLQVVLFDELGMPKTKKTKTGHTTDADALQWLFEKTEHPFLLYLLEHRDATRLMTTAQGLIKAIGPDGRIHTTFRQDVAATGRLSSTDPNLQNIPVRTDEARRIRGVFVVGEGHEALMTADYSQIEMRIMAHLSGDDGLIEAFRTGEDLHNFVASRAFGVPIDEVGAELRRRVKAMSYGLAYGLSAFGLASQLGVSGEEAKAQMDAYFARFGGVRDYLHAVVEEARRKGYTETLFGRRRYLPDLTSDNQQQRAVAERAALNAPIQGSAADIIKVAMIHVAEALAEREMRSRMLLQVHDELVLEVADGEREELAALVSEQMGSAIELLVPMDVSVGFGANWDAAAH